MITFLKSQAASLISSATDFIVTIIGVQLIGAWYLYAAITGTVSGGIVNFMLGRGWVFRSVNVEVQRQAVRYFFVWCGNLLLNAAGVFALTGYLGITYIISKVLVALSIGFTYNYVLQKKYVFA